MTPEKKARLLAAIGAGLVRLWVFTLRFRLVDRAGVLETPPQKPLLWAFWHNKLFVMPHLFERYFPGRRGAALASESKDGEIISAFIERFGIRPIRGSTSRGGSSPRVSASTYAASFTVLRQRSPATVDTAPMPMPR